MCTIRQGKKTTSLFLWDRGEGWGRGARQGEEVKRSFHFPSKKEVKKSFHSPFRSKQEIRVVPVLADRYMERPFVWIPEGHSCFVVRDPEVSSPLRRADDRGYKQLHLRSLSSLQDLDMYLQAFGRWLILVLMHAMILGGGPWIFEIHRLDLSFPNSGIRAKSYCISSGLVPHIWDICGCCLFLLLDRNLVWLDLTAGFLSCWICHMYKLLCICLYVYKLLYICSFCV